MLNLLWKEWHEQSWKLGFGCIVLSALALIGLRARIVADETMVMWVCFIGFTLLPVLSSTGLVPAERSEGSFQSLLALPISSGKILAGKTVMGLLLCIGPMLAATVVSLLMAGGRELSSFAMLDLYGRSTLAAVSFFVWMMVLTIHFSNEARAALLSIGIMLIFTMLASAAIPYPSVSPIVLTISPMAFVLRFPHEVASPPPFAAVAAVQAVVAVILLAWASRQLAS